MKKNLTTLLLLSVLGFAVFQSCTKKDESPNKDNLPITEEGATDNSVRAESDNAREDVDKVLKTSSLRTGRTEAQDLPCGVIKIDSTNGVYSIKYGKESPCGTKFKSGSIEVELIKGANWGEKDAQLKVTFIDYTITFNASKQTLKFNGYEILTNTTGGFIAELPSKKTITHTIRGNLSVVYTDSAAVTRKWYTTKSRTWNYNNSTLWDKVSLVFNGDSSNYSEVGVNKEGNNFTTKITKEFKYENCGTNFTGPYVLKTGEFLHEITNPTNPLFSGSLLATAGFDITLTVPTRIEDCQSNGYKLLYTIKTGKEETNFTQYQPY